MNHESEPDVYAAQREELMVLLRRMKQSGEPLVVHGENRLSSDDAAVILRKLKRDFAFSRRERLALIDAGFDLEHLFPAG